MKDRINNIDLGKDNVIKIFITFAVPAILAMLTQTTAQLVDSIFIGRYVGPEGISAITIFMPIMTFLIGLATMLSIGGVTMAGIYRGKGNKEVSNNYFNVTLTITSIIAIIFSILMISGVDKLVELIDISDKTAKFIIDYAGTLAYFYLPFLASFVLSFFLKLDGKPIQIVVITFIGVIMNITLDYLLVGQWGYGMKGAAIATGASQLIPAIMFFIYIVFKSTWKIRIPKFIKKQIMDMLLNGSSEFLSMTSISIASFIYNWIIMKYIGENGISAYGIALHTVES